MTRYRLLKCPVLHIVFWFLHLGATRSAINETTLEGHPEQGTLVLDKLEESFLKTINEANSQLQQKPGISMDSISQFMRETEQEIHRLSRYQNELEKEKKEVDRLINQVNVKQLQKLLESLEEIYEKEVILREAKAEFEAEMEAEEDDVEYVSKDDLDVMRQDVDRVIAESEMELKEWILSIVDEEIENYKAEALAQVSDGVTTNECPSVTEAVQNIQSALTKFSQDGIGIVDHARGAEIVHSMTSPTYIPPAESSELLGSVWWRKYIPEDWERILPEGWEHWNVGVPSYVYHSLNVKGAKTAPPETVLEANTLPGACWPMEGRRGQVTFRLAYPIKVESFSVDHVSRKIVPDDNRNSAPKKIVVIGYPPCPEEARCGGVGFDVNDPMEVAHITYDLDGPSVQTFDSVFTQTKTITPPKEREGLYLDEEEEDNDDGEVGESCSQVTASCSSPPRIDILGITVKIVENHGNPDYTCLYRFRVHGDQVHIHF